MNKKKGANTARGRRREKRRGAAKASSGSGMMENLPVRMQGRTFITNTAAANYVLYNLTPTFFGDRSLNMADMYAEWRPVSLKFTSVPAASSAPTVFCLGVSYPPEGVATAPTTLEEMVDFPAFAIGSGLIGNPLPSIHVGRAFFANTPLAWYQTQSTLSDPNFEYCGNLVIGQPNGLNNAIPHPFLVEWELEFRSMLDPAVSMQRMIATMQERKEADFPSLGDKDALVIVPPSGLNYSKAAASPVGQQQPKGSRYVLSCRPA